MNHDPWFIGSWGLGILELSEVAAMLVLAFVLSDPNKPMRAVAVAVPVAEPVQSSGVGGGCRM